MARPMGHEDIQIAIAAAQGADDLGLLAPLPAPERELMMTFTRILFALHPLSNMLYRPRSLCYVKLIGLARQKYGQLSSRPHVGAG